MEGPPDSEGLHHTLEFIAELPLRYRWEFTRRYPCYVKYAGAYLTIKNIESDSCLKEELLARCRMFLYSIGVTFEPPPPGISFDQLADVDQVASAWRDGAIAPQTVRSLVILLMKLPNSLKLDIATLLAESRESRETNFHLMRSVAEFEDPAWDQQPTSSIIGINVFASGRAITEAVTKFVGEAKQKRNISESRRRPDKLKDKLQVWDLREGWIGDGYDLQQEHSFKEIAKKLKRNISSVTTQYYDAFYWVTGKSYSFANWFAAFQHDKVAAAAGPGALRRRHNRQTQQEPASERVASSPNPSETNDGVGAEIPLDTVESRELVRDIQSLIVRGFDDREIAENLELRAPTLVAYIRTRLQELTDQ